MSQPQLSTLLDSVGRADVCILMETSAEKLTTRDRELVSDSVFGRQELRFFTVLSFTVSQKYKIT